MQVCVKCLAQSRWPLIASPTAPLPTLIEMRACEAECPERKSSLGLESTLPLTHSVLLGKVLTSVPVLLAVKEG